MSQSKDINLTGRGEGSLLTARCEIMIERCKSSLLVYLDSHMDELEPIIDQAVRDAINPVRIRERLDSLVRAAVDDILRSVVNEELMYDAKVRQFLARSYVQKIVKEIMKDELEA